ncbi:hypothetical protein BU16DRAFT_530970 [Lophium mytilinum]|uniref:GYF domain-containing protein n=1 Tax=Lophium mytilinum TaxID=390894 RepID=A0A6A6QEP0_9PEZI|nr:hypothetical protein BU16DRAFT_530970 [Lophium mytilinum]
MASKNGYNVPRPKRAGDQFTRTHNGDDSGHSTKKARFDYRNPSTLAADAPDDDPILDLDEIGRGGGKKRNEVIVGEDDTDSENENFDTRADDRAKAKAREEAEANEDDSDEDMFGGAGSKKGDKVVDPAKEGKPKKREVRFLDNNDILGQVEESKSGGHVSADFSLSGKARKHDDSSSSESGDDEERDRIGSDVDKEVGAGGKKKHAPKLDAFNMKNEGEEGKFDETGNFVRNAADPLAVHDTWLDGISKKDLKSAREAHEKREAERQQRALDDDAILTSDVLSTLIAYMDKGETVLESLQRLGKGKPKEKKKYWQRNKRKNGEDMDLDPAKTAADPAETKRKEAVEAITGAADQLFTRGQTDVYDNEREKLIRQYKRETGEDWVGPSRADAENGPAMWEYRWSSALGDGKIHGPYDGPAMAGWDNGGFFGEGAEFRRVGHSGWLSEVDFE